MIKRTLLAAAIFSALPAYAGLTSITAGYDFTDYSGDHGTRNLAFAVLVAKVENATLLFNLSQGRRDYETEHFNATRGQGAVWYKWNNWLTTRTGIAFADNTPVFARQDFRQDINLALLPKTLFTTGYRYTKYYDDVEVDAHARQGREDVGEEDHAIGLERLEGLHRDLVGEIGVLRAFAETGMAIAQVAIHLHVAAGLAHDPDRGTVNGFTPQGAQKTIILQNLTHDAPNTFAIVAISLISVE
mgnify:CR=1 FL=1